MSRTKSKHVALFLLQGVVLSLWTCAETTHALASNNNNNHNNNPLVSRRQLWKVPLGVVGTYGYGRLVYNALSVRDIKYPETHERRVEGTIRQALVAAVPPGNDTKMTSRPLRVLEVGIGTECRILRRGLYDSAFRELGAKNVQQVDVQGVDLLTPKDEILSKARRRLDRLGTDNSGGNIPAVNLEVSKGSITEGLPFVDGYFDSIICCLVLCSVADQAVALQEMKRLLRPNGGTLGYIEHVAVNEDEPYRFLEVQQQVFDPLQQALADNCHLHRYTEEAVDAVFDPSSSIRLEQERFLVNNMWPVSSQACGVVQRIV